MTSNDMRQMASELYDILRNADECTRIRIWRALYADYREGAKTADPNTYMMRDVTDDEWDEVLQKKDQKILSFFRVLLSQNYARLVGDDHVRRSIRNLDVHESADGAQCSIPKWAWLVPSILLSVSAIITAIAALI